MLKLQVMREMKEHTNIDVRARVNVSAHALDFRRLWFLEHQLYFIWPRVMNYESFVEREIVIQLRFTQDRCICDEKIGNGEQCCGLTDK